MSVISNQTNFLRIFVYFSKLLLFSHSLTAIVFALNYIECKSPKPPKTLQKAIKQLKRLDNIVVTKPDKGTGVVVMNKSDYINLLSQASINDTSKFPPVSLQRPKIKGRPLKHYHPLLQKEKHLALFGRFC